MSTELAVFVIVFMLVVLAILTALALSRAAGRLDDDLEAEWRYWSERMDRDS